ncbi:MAG: glycosyltransferase family 4 protein [Acidobacteriota bacterium]|nr:glycosyltransferase family 4 protein [Acidobacteriota bacterium]
MESITGLRQVAISYWDQPIPPNAKNDDKTILVNGGNLSAAKKALLKLPESWRSNRFNGVSGRESLIYLWQVLDTLPKLKPKVVVCYDNYKFGKLLRQKIDWPCRLVLNQQGLSYHLPAGIGAKIYSLKSFDTIWTSTLACYRFDRQRITAYEPLVNVIPNWIDMDQFQPVTNERKKELRTKWELPADAAVVLWLSRLVPKKGAHVLLQSWRKVVDEFPDAILWIAGGGEQSYINYLRSLTANLGLADNVRLQGPVAPEQTPTCYQASDVYVFPTLFTGEGFGLSLLEGMACGLACAASDIAILRELYTEDTVLFVPDPNLEDAFVNPILSLLRDPELRARMGKAARAFGEQHYHHDKILAQLKEFYCRQMAYPGDQQ